MTDRPVALGPQASAELAGPPRLLMVPLGATEQHGPHLPLDTDTRIATALAEAAARRSSVYGHALVAPALPYGSSGEHAGFPGTLSIGAEAMETVLVELVRSAGPEFGSVVLVEGHGGNRTATARALARLTREGRRVRSWAPHLPEGDAHAGRTETALALHLFPQLVHHDRQQAGNRRPLDELWPSLRAGGVAAVSANGVLGDPTGANAQEGEQLFELLTAQLTRVLQAELVRMGPGTAAPPALG